MNHFFVQLAHLLEEQAKVYRRMAETATDQAVPMGSSLKALIRQTLVEYHDEVVADMKKQLSLKASTIEIERRLDQDHRSRKASTIEIERRIDHERLASASSRRTGFGRQKSKRA